MVFLGSIAARSKTRIVCSALISFLVVAGSQNAAATTTVNTTMAVSATVLSGCLITATPLAFGNYSVTGTTPTYATATITATCSSGITYTIALGAGAGTGATVAARTMTDGTDKLNYLLYKDSGHTTLLGDGTLSTATDGGTSALLPQNYTVYGSIPISQQVEAGIYLDTVGVTLSY